MRGAKKKENSRFVRDKWRRERRERKANILAEFMAKVAPFPAVVFHGVFFDAKEQDDECEQLDNLPTLPSKGNNGTATTSEQVAVALDGETSFAMSIETQVPITTDPQPDIATQPEIKAAIAAVLKELVNRVHAAAGVVTEGPKIKQDVPAAKEADAIDEMAKTDVTNSPVLSEGVVAGQAANTLQPAATLMCSPGDVVLMAGESAADKADAGVAAKDISTLSGGEGVTGAGGLVTEGVESSVTMPELGMVELEGGAKEEPHVDQEVLAEVKTGEGVRERPIRFNESGAFWRTPECDGMVVDAVDAISHTPVEQVVQAADVASPTTAGMFGGLLTSVLTSLAPAWVTQRLGGVKGDTADGGLGTAAELTANDMAAEPVSAATKKKRRSGQGWALLRKLSGGAMAVGVNIVSVFKDATAGLGKVSWTVVKSALFFAADCIDMLIGGAKGCRKAIGGVAMGLMRCVMGGVWGC